jgi:hypothetical protein
MTELYARFRAVAWWLLPMLALAALIGWEIDWGRGLRRPVPPAQPIAASPVAPGLLPGYAIAGGLPARTETVNRTLFNPTRRPAPTALAEAAKPRMQRGLYTLTGTTVSGSRNLAFLKEQNGGKPRTVKQGDTINGMLVAEVKADRVKFTLGDESEEVVLRVATNSKPTPQPPPPAPDQPTSVADKVAGDAPPAQPGAVQTGAQTLAQRRAAARAQAAAAAANAGNAPPPAVAADGGQPAPPPATTGQTTPGQAADPGWAQVYQRYQQRRQKQD